MVIDAASGARLETEDLLRDTFDRAWKPGQCRLCWNDGLVPGVVLRESYLPCVSWFRCTCARGDIAGAKRDHEGKIIPGEFNAASFLDVFHRHPEPRDIAYPKACELADALLDEILRRRRETAAPVERSAPPASLPEDNPLCLPAPSSASR